MSKFHTSTFQSANESWNELNGVIRSWSNNAHDLYSHFFNVSERMHEDGEYAIATMNESSSLSMFPPSSVAVRPWWGDSEVDLSVLLAHHRQLRPFLSHKWAFMNASDVRSSIGQRVEGSAQSYYSSSSSASRTSPSSSSLLSSSYQVMGGGGGDDDDDGFEGDVVHEGAYTSHAADSSNAVALWLPLNSCGTFAFITKKASSLTDASRQLGAVPPFGRATLVSKYKQTTIRSSDGGDTPSTTRSYCRLHVVCEIESAQFLHAWYDEDSMLARDLSEVEIMGRGIGSARTSHASATISKRLGVATLRVVRATLMPIIRQAASPASLGRLNASHTTAYVNPVLHRRRQQRQEETSSHRKRQGWTPQSNYS